MMEEDFRIPYLDDLIDLVRMRVPYDDWPQYMKDIGGVCEELLGPAEEE